MAVELWVEKYRPSTLDAYVWQNAGQRKKAEEWLASGVLPNLLFAGSQGTGKTSLAMLLLKQLGVSNGDILFKNASRERKIDDLQDQIVNFASTWALNDSGFKYVVLDEADSLSPMAQRFLRGEIEKFSDSCRFILTCNYPQKIIPALKSRLQEFEFSKLDYADYMARAGEILVTENIKFDIDDLSMYCEKTFPDLRKCIGLMQQNVQDGVLPPLADEQGGTKDYLVAVADMFTAGKYIEARTLIVEQAQVEEYPEIFRFFYQHLELWGTRPDQHDSALLAIRRGLVNHALVADPEINLAATLVELGQIASS